jgi:hypothetical protein
VLEEMSGAVASHIHAADRVLGADIFVRCCLELVAARRAAEMKQVALMLDRRLAGGGVDDHAADGIANHCFGCGFASVIVMGVSGVIFGMSHLKKSSICSGMNQ